MSDSSNYRRNKAAADQFRNELRIMLSDIADIDRQVMNRALNAGVAFAKRRTPVGVYSNPVVFTVKNGKDVGKAVSFKIKNKPVGGFLRSNWHKLPTGKMPGGIEAEIVNTADYASYWNYGHRIVTKKGGPTKGFVTGTHVLEKTVSHVNKRMAEEFEKAVREVQEKHDR